MALVVDTSAGCMMRISKFAIALVVILLCASAYDIGTDLSYRTELSNSVDEINKDLPQFIAPGVRFDRASLSPPRTIRFDYTLLGVESKSDRSPLVDSLVDKSGLAIACHSDAYHFVEHGATFIITFYGEDGEEVTHAKYDAERCSKNR